MIFVDTSFWVAVYRARDPHHDPARRLFLEHQRSQLVTTNHVRGETWTYLRSRAGHAHAARYLDLTEPSAALRVVHVSEALEVRAVAWLKARDEREYSFVDATSFVVMRQQGIARVLAFDGDFSAAGFVELRV